MDFTSRLKAAEAVARKAGEMLVHHGRVREDGFFGEEGGGDTDCKGRWIVDPIDGTQSFMRGHAFYAVSIGYEYEGELVIGVVYIPYMDEMYTAVRGQGATMN
ncbi:MAG: inositol monophosphatase, partial [Clostridia bacterium]|nr:inositol monophosphatase [Clostridia bacterium]